MNDENKTTRPSLPEFIQFVKESKAMTENESSKCLQVEYRRATIIAVENAYLLILGDKQYMFGTLGEAGTMLVAFLCDGLSNQTVSLMIEELKSNLTRLLPELPKSEDKS